MVTMKNGILKNDEVICKKGSKQKFKTMLKVAGISLAGLVLGTGISTYALRTFKNDLPNMTRVESVLDETNSRTDITKQDKARVVFPRSGVVKVNVLIPDEKLSNDFKEALYDTVWDYNKMLEQVNPKFRMDINYNPTLSDRLFYAFNIYEDDYTSKNNGMVVGNEKSFNLNTVNGEGKYNVRIGIDLDKIKANCQPEQCQTMIKNALLHEFGHGFGLDDEYTLQNYDYNTIMSSVSMEKNKTISPSDFRILLARYSNDNDFENWNEKYEEFSKNTAWYSEALEDAKFLKNNLTDAIKRSSSLRDAKESDFNFANINNVCYGVEKTIVGQFDDVSMVYDSFNSMLIDGDNVNYVDVYGSLAKGYVGRKANYFASQVDGMTYINGKNTFCAEYKDKIVEFSISKNNRGERYVSGVFAFDKQDMDRQEFKVAREKALNFAEKWSTPQCCDNNLVKIAGNYLIQNDEKSTNLTNLNGMSFCSSGGKNYHFGEKTVTISDGNEYFYRMLDGVVLTSSHVTLVNTSNGMVALNNTVDIKNDNVHVSGASVLQKGQTHSTNFNANNTSQNDYRVK